jgi:hypothetical protein
MNDVSIQKALQMSPPALLAFVRTKALSRSELRVVIDDLAAARRVPGQTRTQAYLDFVTADALGRELYEALNAVADTAH